MKLPPLWKKLRSIGFDDPTFASRRGPTAHGAGVV